MSTTRTDKSSSAGAQFAESPSLNASMGHIKLVGTVGKEKTYTPQQGQEERPYIPIDLTVSWEKDGKTYTKEGNDVYVQFRVCRYVPGSTKDHAAVSLDGSKMSSLAKSTGLSFDESVKVADDWYTLKMYMKQDTEVSVVSKKDVKGSTLKEQFSKLGDGEVLCGTMDLSFTKSPSKKTINISVKSICVLGVRKHDVPDVTSHTPKDLADVMRSVSI
ncbi:hypothetical protein JB92DRAFT_3110794 [Gautieria morchelliformis]|nr:hypothetical protein JB92DRAFT_3110794 [Gautieria morchelliformis]